MAFLGNGYFESLVKRVINIVVTWNVLMLCLFGGFIIFVFSMIFLVAAVSGATATEPASAYTTVYGSSPNQLLSIPVSGVITGTDAGSGGIFSALDSQTAGYSVKDELYRAAADGSIQGVILEINSPGGTIYGAHAIADGVEYYRSQTHKPIYAHISGTGASGAYWAAASTDKILVDYGSDVGSIGVIMGPFQYYNTVLSEDSGLLGSGVVTQNGIESVTITAGKSKDVGNPYRKLTSDEIAALQKQVNNEYDDFVSYVSKRRGIDEATIRNQIGAMAYDQRTALAYHLSDATMNRQDAYDTLAKAAGYPNDYSVVQEQPSYGFVRSLFMAVSHQQQPKAQEVDLCSLSQASLAYHGDISSWCK